MPYSHRNLVAWKRADELVLHVYRLTAGFPESERFGLSSQLRRAAFSTAANIVEGFARGHYREREQFLRTAWGSLAELEYGLEVAVRLGYLDAAERTSLAASLEEAAACLLGLIRATKQKREAL